MSRADRHRDRHRWSFIASRGRCPGSESRRRCSFRRSSPRCAATSSAVIGTHHRDAVAYVSGVMGTLIGADLLNLRKLGDLGAPVASIGGAGTFDGIFLTGIVAVLLA